MEKEISIEEILYDKENKFKDFSSFSLMTAENLLSKKYFF